MCSCDDLDEFGLDRKFFEGLLSIFLSQFRQIMETQFLSFNASVNVTNFEALSACIFSWLEEYCKPQVSGLEYHTLLHTAFIKNICVGREKKPSQACFSSSKSFAESKNSCKFL